jgi:hypothetical protein
MPAGKVYRKKRKVFKKKKVFNNKKKYRRQVATVARPLNVKPRSAVQNVTYYNSFLCRPVINQNGTVGSKQQNYFLKMNLNSIWPFDAGYRSSAQTFGQICNPNEDIEPYVIPVTDAMTSMPNVRDGANLFSQYSECCVVGTKVTLVATPISNTQDVQLGYLYAIKHSQPNTGLDTTSTINEINKMPYRKMAKLQGVSQQTSTNIGTGAKLVITHSPKKFNNVKDLRDNPQMMNRTGANTAANKPAEADFLSVGCIPALNELDKQVTDFCLQVRIEQRLLWTEPLENLNQGTGNYSFPWAAAGVAAGLYSYGAM